MSKKSEHKKGIVLIHEVHDLWPKTLIDVGRMKPYHPFVLLMGIGERKSYKYSDYIACTLENAEEYMKKRGLSSGKFIFIPNGISEDEWKDQKPLSKGEKLILEKFKAENKFIVGYCGGFAVSNALDRLIETASKIDNSNIVFVLVGDGTEKKRLQEKVAEEGINNVIFMNPIQKKCVPELLSYFDCVYMGVEKELRIYDYGISSTKMYDSMMAGVPIVMSMSRAKTPIEKYQCGIKCDVNDRDSLKFGIEKLYTMSDIERKALGDNGKKAIEENFRYVDLAQRYENLFPDNTKTILVINHYAGSTKMGMDFRQYYLAKEWEKKGYKVNMIAADYSHLRRINPDIKKDFQIENVEGICYFWVKTSKYLGNGAKRAITMFQFVGKLILNAKKIARIIKPDVIITASTYPLDIFAAKRIRKYIK